MGLTLSGNVKVAELYDRDHVLRALDAAHWIVKDAAEALGVSRQALYDAMERLQIERRAPDPAVKRAAHARRPGNAA